MRIPVWAAFGLLFFEFLSFSVAFDSQPLGERIDAWGVAGPLGSLAVLVVCAAAGVALVVHADRLRVQHVLLARRLDAGAAGTLTAHALGLAVLWWLTTRIFAPEGPPPGHPAVWLSAWGLAGLTTVLSALGAALPRGSLRPLVRAVWPACLAGAVIGAGGWVAGQSSALLWWPLGPLTLRAAGLLLSSVLHGAVSDPCQAMIGSERFQVVVAPVCSGFEGVGLMGVFVASYLVLARRQLRFPQSLLLLPISFVAAWAANVVRLVLLVVVGTKVSEKLAAGGFHARAGWVLFSGVALSLVAFVRRSRWFAREPAAADFSHPIAAYLLPFLVLVGVALVTGLVTKDFDYLYGVRMLAAVPVLVAFRRHYGDIKWSWTALGSGLVAAVAAVLLTPKPSPETADSWHREWQALPGWGQLCWLVLRVGGSVLVVPLAEELAFRGYLLRRLIAREFTAVSPALFAPWALLISSAAFGAVHHGWLAGTIAGLLFGAAQIRGGSVGQAVLAHAVSNAAIAACVLGFGQWWLWM